MRIDARIDANRCVHQAKYLIRDPMSLLSTVALEREAEAFCLGIPSVLQAASKIGLAKKRIGSDRGAS